jgi:AcrR family transcriptional regulator
VPQTDRSPAPPPTTAREQAKAQRRQDLLAASATLFAERGFAGVSIDDIGAAAGVSGPAVYRHFTSKQAVLGAVLLEVSSDLLERGRAVAEHAPAPDRRLQDLVSLQVEFALHRPAVIVVQDREMLHLTDEDRRTVRVLQRGYVTLWAEALRELAPARDVADLTLRAQAVFGLVNSTPHSLRAAHRLRAPQEAQRLDAARTALEEMAWAALRTAFEPIPTSTGGTP